jgi:regulator of nonsense transcripts 1
VPQLRKGRRGECLAPNLKEAAQLYLKEHLEDFPFISGLLSAEHPDEIQSDDNLTDENVKVEWDALFTRVLEETDFVITTPVGAAKIGPYFHPQLVIFDEAARARELGTLVALACFPTAEAWLFAGNVEMTKPYLASNGSKLWNPCADQLRTSLVARYLHAVPDTHRLSLNHQAYGNLHTLSSDLFWDGHIDSALPSDERFPPSTVHLLDYCRSLASNQKLTVPRLLVHVRSSEAVDMKQKSKFNKSHQHWVVNRILRDLAQDPEFRSTDGNEPGSILVTTPYKASFTNYRKSINGLLQELDREYRLAGSHGRRLHREVLIEARTADTCQGHAADVVVFDLVSPQITSHVADPNRLSSALTRAKQAEIIVMERGMLWREETANIRRGYRVTKSHIDELYEHCRSNGQVVIVDPVDDSQIKREYSLHRADAESVRDPSAVPRQLPVLPPSLDLPQDHEEAKASPAAAASDLSAPEGYGDDGDAESMFGLGGDVGYEMVRKAMELGLNLSADADGRR